MTFLRPQMHVVASRPQEKPKNITLISSGKGGVGKTWFSITTAHVLSQKGRKVLLFDGDLGMANVDVQLGVMPQRDLGHFMNGQLGLPEIITRYPNGGFDIIAGRSGSGNMARFPEHKLILLQEEIKKLSQDYDHILIDLGAGIGRSARSLSDISSECLMVVTDEPTSLTDAYAFIKVNTRDIPTLPFKIVVNQADTFYGGKRTFETIAKVCKEFLKRDIELAGIIRRDKCVREAVRFQCPTPQRHPSSPAVEDVKKLLRDFL